MRLIRCLSRSTGKEEDNANETSNINFEGNKNERFVTYLDLPDLSQLPRSIMQHRNSPTFDGIF